MFNKTRTFAQVNIKLHFIYKQTKKGGFYEVNFYNIFNRHFGIYVPIR